MTELPNSFVGQKRRGARWRGTYRALQTESLSHFFRDHISTLKTQRIRSSVEKIGHCLQLLEKRIKRGRGKQEESQAARASSPLAVAGPGQFDVASSFLAFLRANYLLCKVFSELNPGKIATYPAERILGNRTDSTRLSAGQFLPPTCLPFLSQKLY